MGIFGGGGPTVPPEQWGQGPMIPGSIFENYYIRVTGGGNRVQIYHEDYEAGAAKPKKERRGFFLFQKPTGDRFIDRMLGRANRRAIREDEWRRDQGGGQIVRGGYGQATDWAPGPPRGFSEIPQAGIDAGGPPPGWQPGPF